MTTNGQEHVLEVRGVSKGFPGVQALRGVSLDVRAGEVHVLFGENGAGKSTLVNLLAGTYAPDAGTVSVAGRQIERFAPERARSMGVNAVFQDFSLVPKLSVRENLSLGRPTGRHGFVSRAALDRQGTEALAAVGEELPLNAIVDTLSRAQQQLVEIAKALLGEPRLLILDEPTTSLTEREVDRLFELVGELRDRGLGIIYITHRMAEIWRLADRITVLRDGEVMATTEVGEVDEAELIRLMTGRSFEQLYPRAARRPGPPLLELQAVSGPKLTEASLEVRGGEVVGVAGLVGSGKGDIGRLCFGLDELTGGRVLLRGEPPRRLAPDALLRSGLIYYPANRRDDGLVPMLSVRANITQSAMSLPDLVRAGFLRRRTERRLAEEAVRRLRIQPPDLERAVELLSGGNQQKVVLARALLRDADVHIFDEPTAGVDVGARVEVYQFIRELCEQGRGILLISSDLPEVVNLSHRLYVIHDGRVQAELVGDQITEENVLAHCFDSQPLPAQQEIPA